MWALGRNLLAWPRNYVGLKPAVIQQLAANINRGTWIQATALRIILRCGCLWKGTKKRSQRRLMWQVPGTLFLCDICNRVCSATRSRRRFNGAPTAVAVGTPLNRRLLSLLSVRAWAAGGATGQCRGILFEPDVSSGNVRLKAPPAMRCRLHIKQGVYTRPPGQPWEYPIVSAMARSLFPRSVLSGQIAVGISNSLDRRGDEKMKTFWTAWRSCRNIMSGITRYGAMPTRHRVRTTTFGCPHVMYLMSSHHTWICRILEEHFKLVWVSTT